MSENKEDLELRKEWTTPALIVYGNLEDVIDVAETKHQGTADDHYALSNVGQEGS